MASFVSSTFTTGERRKKSITYGKLSRLAPPRPSLVDDNTPSSDQSDKHAAASSRPPAGTGGLAKSTRPSGSIRAPSAGPDVFDVPSEDEFDFQPPTTPAKRLVTQRSKVGGPSRGSVFNKRAAVPDRAASTIARPPQKSVVATSVGTQALPPQKQAKPRESEQEADVNPVVLPTRTTSQPKMPRVTEDQRRASPKRQQLQRSDTSPKDASRATTLGLPTRPATKGRPSTFASTTLSNKRGKSVVQQPITLDVFDVPSDDGEASVPMPKAPGGPSRNTSVGTAKRQRGSKTLLDEGSRKAPNNADHIGNLQNRKRKGSTSLAVAPKPIVEHLQATSKQQQQQQQRDRKIAKRQERVSPGNEPARARPAQQATIAETTVNKPRRTRTRTLPVASHPVISKGQSSPAILRRMLPTESDSMMSYENATTEVPASDDTMYDIPDPTTTPLRVTPLRKSTTSMPGSVTPRQKDLFSTLLGDSAAPKTPASALASLQLTDKKPKSLLGTLARSKSDISHSDQSRRPRLIDTLKDEDYSSEEDDSESDDAADNHFTEDVEMDNDKTPVQAKRTLVIGRDEADSQTNGATTADSQTSQTTSGAVTRPRLTYASHRSYLQEANSEGDLLGSMDLDDGWKLDSQTVSTDDEEPTSQPRTHHELRKHGQNTMFSWDMEESIREISNASNKSMQRSAMMDLCTKMTDAGFVNQLLDSGFMHKLLENMTSYDDVIFNFLAAAAVLFILDTKPAFLVVDQMNRSGIATMVVKIVDKDADILRIARDRKSNMSKIALESLADFRALVLASKAWPFTTLDKMSPQLLALRVIDLLFQSLRESGSTEVLLTAVDVSTVVNVCSKLSTRVEATPSSGHDVLALDLAVSALEIASFTDQNHSTWPVKILQQLSSALPVFFQNDTLMRTVEAMKLCMNLTNNKPKFCQPFCTQAFVGSLMGLIVARFGRLYTGERDPEDRAKLLADLTLGLGAMINLAELNDKVRLNAIRDTESVETLVKIFVSGAERADEASSVEESEISVVIGFLAVLLGMLCLNSNARTQIQALLPDQQLEVLLENMKQFARIHEHVDKRTANRFEGPEGQEALNNYNVRIMHVVRTLESAER
ncbi:hypothetical protein OPT61_g715 [Boeremia exigua]|uniref:Uncharacterized protein n=1 Tax=Boeremia exigua TaxID=749465 RepID=A0ACC2IT08_9PLEO|nr:hypothetical protein OPT61_g715 [Boeremia exigua]